jgi:hypothetical protein
MKFLAVPFFIRNFAAELKMIERMMTIFGEQS